MNSDDVQSWARLNTNNQKENMADEPQELYKKYRPRMLKQVRGQSATCRTLAGFLKSKTMPHTLLFTGPSGCGKTTLARIVAKKLGCSANDCTEVNSADFNGIEMVRSLRKRLSLAPLNGTCRIWIVDECHELSKQAQEAFLKILEDTPTHVYFMLATTNPTKLSKALLNRCTELKVSELNTKALTDLVTFVIEEEEIELSGAIIKALVEAANGSARASLVMLHQIRQMTDEKEQLSIIKAGDIESRGIDLARKLLQKKVAFPAVCKILKDMKDEPETVRRIVLSYASSCALGNVNLQARAFCIIDAFRENYYDTGKAGLFASCYTVFSESKNASD